MMKKKTAMPIQKLMMSWFSCPGSGGLGPWGYSLKVYFLRLAIDRHSVPHSQRVVPPIKLKKN